jgi:hypothetical protein
MVFGNEYRVHVQEVIPMKSKAYRAVDVNRVDIEQSLEGRAGVPVHIGFDIGKEMIVCILRWGIGDFDRVWKVRNTADVERVAEVLRVVGRGRSLIAAMEPTGTYGDALRQALERAGVVVHRVSPKQASDYAEVFDGVPSQHDGKDAAVVAELAAQGKSWLWPMPKPTEREQELAYLVDWMDGQRRQMMQWCGRLEAQVSRHWPEATRIVSLTSGTLLHCLAKYGGPRGLAADPKALAQVRKWGRSFLTAEKAQGAGGQRAHDAGDGDGHVGRRADASVRAADSSVSAGNVGVQAAFGRIGVGPCGDPCDGAGGRLVDGVRAVGGTG